MTFEEYLSRQPYDEESTDLTISHYSEEEYSKLMRELAEEFNYNLKTVKGREEAYKALLRRKSLRRLYSSITVVPNLDNVSASYCQITKKEYAEYRNVLNKRIYEYLSSATEKRYAQSYEKWQQDNSTGVITYANENRSSTAAYDESIQRRSFTGRNSWFTK